MTGWDLFGIISAILVLFFGLLSFATFAQSRDPDRVELGGEDFYKAQIDGHDFLIHHEIPAIHRPGCKKCQEEKR